MTRLILSRQNFVYGGLHKGRGGTKWPTETALAPSSGSARSGSWPKGTKNTDVGGGLTQLHQRVFVPGNKAKLQKTFSLVLCLLGRNCVRFTNVGSKFHHFRLHTTEFLFVRRWFDIVSTTALIDAEVALVRPGKVVHVDEIRVVVPRWAS